jgi:molybdate transport system substrate-binding protein
MGAEVVAGRADLAIRQVRELIFVDGVTLAGRLPAEVQQYTNFSAACGMIDSNETGKDFLSLLITEDGRNACVASGLEPFTGDGSRG